MDRRKTRGRTALWRGLALAFLLGFLLSGGMLVRDLRRSARERAANRILVQRVEREVRETGPSAADSAARVPERDYLPLCEDNGDLAAWLIIEDTQVNYPVLYTPEDPEYYLHRAFDGSHAYSGSLFIAADCVPDGTNIIIYGHKMKDGTMFGELDAYADAAYGKTHPEIIYDLIRPDGGYERLTFEVMAAFYSRVYQIDEENVFRYYYGTDLSDPERFQEDVDEAVSASLYDLGVTAEYGDRLLTLSTCSYHTAEGRFVVVAREKSGISEGG